MRLGLSLLVCSLIAPAQEVRIREAPYAVMPGQVDSNSPAFWRGGQLYLFNSTGGDAVISRGADQFQLGGSRTVRVSAAERWPTWIESVWVDPAGPIFAFYHQEDFSVCGGRLAQPSIGMAVSQNNGRSFADLGLVLTSGDPPDCASENGYFAGGHGDVSVAADQEGEYLYFFFGNYNGPLDTQGVVAARMRLADRYNPVGRVWKYYQGTWSEPGLRGRTSPLFPAAVEWQRYNTDSFWGPSIHWNTYLQAYVILMNRSCCTSGWPQESIYITFNPDLANPSGWSEPQAIFYGFHWYPQVLGLGPEETDSVAGQKARIWIFGESSWEIEFYHSGMAPPEEEPEPVAPEPEPDDNPFPHPEPDPAIPENPDAPRVSSGFYRRGGLLARLAPTAAACAGSCAIVNPGVTRVPITTPDE